MPLKRKTGKIDVTKVPLIELQQESNSKELTCNNGKLIKNKTDAHVDSSHENKSDTSSTMSYHFMDNLTPLITKQKRGMVLLSQGVTSDVSTPDRKCSSLPSPKKSTQILLPSDLSDTPIIDARKEEQLSSSLDVLVDTPEVDICAKLSSANDVFKGKKIYRRDRIRGGKTISRLSMNDHTCPNDDPSLCHFLDLEAEDDGEESDEDEIENSQISHTSFINDSSQLSYSQDGLDLAERHNNSQPCKSCEQDILPHRAFYRSIDNRQILADNFSTPVLKRNHQRKSRTTQNHSQIETQTSVASSDKALGNMNFIRSVIEHHRKGGDANEIEAEYHFPHEENTQLSPNNGHITKHSEMNPKIHKKPHTSIQLSPTLPEKEQTLTDEQKTRIELNRLKAMKIRNEKMSLEKTNTGNLTSST